MLRAGYPTLLLFFSYIYFKEGGGRFIHAQDQQERSHKPVAASRSTERAFTKMNAPALRNTPFKYKKVLAFKECCLTQIFVVSTANDLER